MKAEILKQRPFKVVARITTDDEKETASVDIVGKDPQWLLALFRESEEMALCLRGFSNEIDHFEQYTAEREYTDVGDVWELLYNLRRRATRMLDRVEQTESAHAVPNSP